MLTLPRPALLLSAILAALVASAAPATAAARPAGTPGPFHPALRERPPLLPDGPLPAAADEPVPPAGDRGYDVRHYDLDLTIDVGDAAVAGTVGVDLRALAAPLTRVRLDLVDDLTVTAVAWAAGGAAAAPASWTHAGDSLVVDLPEPLPPAAPGRLEIAYGGRPPPHGPFRAGLMFRQYDGAPIVASMSEPSSAHAWWPCKDHPSDKATADLAFTVPDTLPWSLTAVSNGRLRRESVPRPGWRRFEWTESWPIATYLVSVAVGDFVAWQEDCASPSGTVPLFYHVFPVKEVAARHDLAPTCEMIGFLEGLAGPYPFAGEKYAQATISWGGAMENQTATSLGAFMLTGDGRYEALFAHELAHQWFGDALSPARWRDIWLNEGFARYCEALWAEHRGGREAYLARMRSLRDPISHPDLFAGEGTLADPDPILPNLLVYDKGAWVLHMLRGWLGDGTFFDLLRSWAADPGRRHANVTTEDFVDHVAAAVGPDAVAFLTPWLRTDAVPQLAWTARVSRLPGGGSEVRLQARQLQRTLFLLPLPVHLRTAGGDLVRQAVLRSWSGSFTWRVAGEVDSVLVDPQEWLLLRQAEAPPPRLAVTAVRPNPVGADGALVEFGLREPAHLTVRLHDARGRRLGAWDLGRLEPAPAEDPQPTWRFAGRAPDGRPLPAGVYWLEARAAEGGRAVARLVLVR